MVITFSNWLAKTLITLTALWGPVSAGSSLLWLGREVKRNYTDELVIKTCLRRQEVNHF